MLFEILLGVALALVLLPLLSLVMTWLTKTFQRLLDKRCTKGEARRLNTILSRFLSILAILLVLAVFFFVL
jgi:hypothetical protein